MTINRQFLAAHVVTVAGASLLAQPALAQGGGATFQGEIFGGIARDERPLTGRKDDFSGGVLPSITFSSSGTVVAQIDGMIADHLGETVLAGAGHLGFRASEAFTLGVYGAYADFDTFRHLNSYRIGGEARYSSGPITLSAIMGYEHSERAAVVVGPVAGFTVVDDYGRGGSFFSMVDASIYPKEGVSLTAGHRYMGRQHAAALGGEAALGSSGVSFFAEGRIGDAGYTAGWAGIRIKLGHGRTALRDKDQAGFTNRLKDELFVPANLRRRSFVPSTVVPPPPDDGEGSCCGACYT